MPAICFEGVTEDVAKVFTEDVAEVVIGDVAKVFTEDVAKVVIGDVAKVFTEDVAKVVIGDVAKVFIGDVANVADVVAKLFDIAAEGEGKISFGFTVTASLNDFLKSEKQN